MHSPIQALSKHQLPWLVSRTIQFDSLLFHDIMAKVEKKKLEEIY